MKKVKVLVLRAAGTNCDLETAYAFRLAGGEVDLAHVNALCAGKNLLAKYHILAIPGGFTYGDDIASGKVLANELRFRLKKQLAGFVSGGGLIIGICNGFQVLVKMGILPAVIASPNGMRAKQSQNKAKTSFFNIEATLSPNDSGRFEDRWVYLRKVKSKKEKGKSAEVWTRDLPDIIYLPVAHGEGKFIVRDEKTLNVLQENSQVVFRYVDASGSIAGYPHNPNGSMDNIAGICDSTGRVFGLMPHPERHISYLQHPNWRRFGQRHEAMGTGLKIFENGVNFVRGQ